MQIPAFDAATLSLRRHDNDNADSSSQFGLTCPEGKSAWALAHSLFMQKLLASCRNNGVRVSCASIVQLRMRWACSCCGTWCCVSIPRKSVAGAPFVHFVGLLLAVVLIIGRSNFRSIGGTMSRVLSSSWASVVCVACPVAVGFGWRCRGFRGRGSLWLFESATHTVAFHGVQFKAVLCRSEPSRV